MKIARIEPLVLHVSAKTNWFFIRVSSDAGLRGVGEASLNGWESVQRAYLEHIGPKLEGRAVTDIAVLTRVYPHAPAGLIGASVLSAIEQALTDILAQDAGLPVYGWLGNHRRASFP
ncbi:MAG: hypothetical protein ABIS68_10735, partial [Casimicrobiaceae bacterium]